MTLLHRRLIYLSFFLIFFLAAPIILLWAEGYRYNFKKHQLQKTGVLFLESKPNKAEIYLNGKLQKEKTTARLKNLLPDEYQIEIKKDGYETWQKKLTVKPGETTFAQYIRLFKENPVPKNILPFKIITTSEVEDGGLAFVYEGKSNTALITSPSATSTATSTNKIFKLALFDLETQVLTDLSNLNFWPEEIILSPKKLFLALKQNKKIFIFNIQNKKLLDLESITKQAILSLKWEEANREETVYGLSSQGLEKINLMAQTSLLLLNRPATDFYLLGNEVFLLEKTKTNIIVRKTNFGRLENFEVITTLPLSSYLFQKSPADFLTLLDQENQILYLIRTNAASCQTLTKCGAKIFPETKRAQWLNNEMLMFSNNFEISTYESKKDEEKIITRLSSIIKKALWYPVATHLIYLTDKDINIMELPEPQRNLYTIIQKNGIKDLFVNTKGDKIYFVDESGLNEVEIQ